MNSTSRISKKKYSNIVLFNKREKDLQKKKEKLFDSESKNITKINRLQKSNERKSKLCFPIFSNSNRFIISDRESEMILRKKLLKRIRLDKKPNNITKNHNLFITESPSFISYKKLSSNNLDKGKNKSLIINNSKYMEKDNNYSSINNANILLQFENEKNLAKNKDKNGNEKIHILNLKRQKLNRKNSVNKTDYISKEKEINLLLYNSKVKNEGNKIKLENYENKLESYNDTLKLLNKIKKLLDFSFIDKITEYLRFIKSKKKFEKSICKILIDHIIIYKNDIKSINQKIKKKIAEKNYILKWIYFQIQLKEKKLCLPSYYRTIIEKIEIKKKMRQSAVFRSKSMLCIKSIKKEIKKHPIEKRKNIKSLKKQNISTCNEFNSENGLFYNYEIDLDNPIYSKEINKIKYYRYHCVYNSIDEFEGAFKFLENNIIKMMNHYYNLKKNIFYFKNELSNIKNNINNKEIIDRNSLREKEFNKLKEVFKYKIKLKQKNKYKNDNSFLGDNSTLYHYYTLPKNDNNFTILNKIKRLNKTCKSLGLKYNPEFVGGKKSKKNYEKNIIYEILSKLKYINFVADYLLTKSAIYNSNNYEQKSKLNKIRNEIEANHRIEKSAQQRLRNSQKYILLKNKIEERNNKIYFLPYKKLDIFRNKKAKEQKTEDIKINKSQVIQINDFFE